MVNVRRTLVAPLAAVAVAGAGLGVAGEAGAFSTPAKCGHWSRPVEATNTSGHLVAMWDRDHGLSVQQVAVGGQVSWTDSGTGAEHVDTLYYKPLDTQFRPTYSIPIKVARPAGC